MSEPESYRSPAIVPQAAVPHEQTTAVVPAANWPPANPQSQVPSQWSVNAAPHAPQVNIAFKENGPGYLVRGLWFVFVGWWLGYLTIALSYALILLVVTFPLGMMLLNRIPQVMTLRPRTRRYQSTQIGSTVSIDEQHLPQHFWLARVVYFLLIGWWLGLLWVNLAYLFGITLIGLPLSFWMYGRVGGVVSLHRN
jgi:uncharacterized membrane protein YccF (DUF307 family)